MAENGEDGGRRRRSLGACPAVAGAARDGATWWRRACEGLGREGDPVPTN